MEQQEHIDEPVATEQSPWEAPQLVKVDVSKGTLSNFSAHGSDGVFSS